MNIALRRFIEEKGQDLIDKGLYRNFVLHVCNLFEFGVLGPAHVFGTIMRLQKFIHDQGHEFKDWMDQRDHWVKHAPIREIEASEKAEKDQIKARKDFSGLFKSRALVVLKDIISHSNGSNMILNPIVAKEECEEAMDADKKEKLEVTADQAEEVKEDDDDTVTINQ